MKLHFGTLDSIVANAFDIIHFDVWTSPITNISGLKYYVIFLDHYIQYL